MNIVAATSSHIEWITRLLCAFYEKANWYMGYPMYISNYDILEKYIRQRIQEPHSKFSYFVYQEWSSVHGFVNVLVEQKHSELLVLITDDEHKNKEVIAGLFDSAIHFVKEKDMFPVHFELFPDEDIFADLLQERGARMYTSKWFLNK